MSNLHSSTKFQKIVHAFFKPTKTFISPCGFNLLYYFLRFLVVLSLANPYFTTDSSVNVKETQLKLTSKKSMKPRSKGDLEPSLKIKTYDEALRRTGGRWRTPFSLAGKSTATQVGNTSSDEPSQTAYAGWVSATVLEMPLQTMYVNLCNQHAQESHVAYSEGRRSRMYKF